MMYKTIDSPESPNVCHENINEVWLVLAKEIFSILLWNIIPVFPTDREL